MSERGPHDPRRRYVNDLLTICATCGHRLERVPNRPNVWWHS